MLANGGQHEGLFRAAILQSGSQALAPRFGPTEAASVAAYGLLLVQTGCWTFNCLRTRPSQQILEAQSTIARLTSIAAVSCESILHLGYR